MKKNYFILAVIVSFFLASCSNEEYVGDNSSTIQNSNAIAFGGGFKAITRGESYGADAAALLNKRFVVGGFKKDGTTYKMVFDNYGVKWTENSAGKTESNTSDWEYVGLAKSPTSQITSNQTIKFWDYSTSSYDFIAYSTGTAAEVSGDPSTGQVKVTAISHDNLSTQAYTLSGSKDDLAKCYIADLVTVNKADYGKEVQLTFHSLASKVRMAIYETVPGYSVTNVKFYDAHPTTLGTSSTTTAALIGTFSNNATYKVYYDNSKKAQVSLTSNGNDTKATFGTFTSDAIAISSATPTYAPGEETTTHYTKVLPNGDGSALELAVDYTLESDDGSGEVINVYGATAYIPAIYTKWQPNFAYTYLFKISDNTNGWTSKTNTDPKGLFPITFDAIVLDNQVGGTQSTITTVASPSITTYQKGHDPASDEYSASATAKDIYIQVMVDNTLKTDVVTKGALYTVTTTNADISEATVMDALNITESAGVGRNGITLTAATLKAATTIPGEDGNDITPTSGSAAQFTPAAPEETATVKYYAYVYDTETWNGTKVHLTTTPADFTTTYYSDAACTTLCTGTIPDGGGDYYQKESYIYSAVKMTSDTAPTDWTTEGVWWKDSNGGTAVEAWNAANNGKTFYKRYTVNGKVYGVKVIKVVN